MEWFAGTGGVLVYCEVDEANTPMRGCNAAFDAVEDRSDEAEILDVDALALCVHHAALLIRPSHSLNC